LITLTLTEETSGECPTDLSDSLAEILQYSDKLFKFFVIQTYCFYNISNGQIISKNYFLGSDIQEINTLNNLNYFNLLSQYIPVFYFPALRDNSQEFGLHGQFWNNLLKDTQISIELQKELETKFHNINNLIIDSNINLKNIQDYISLISTIIPLDKTNPVFLESISTRIFDMVQKIQILFKSNHGVTLPMNRHGLGIQNLAFLKLIQAFIQSNLLKTYSPLAKPILIIEEPEAHLHPSAIRSLLSFLDIESSQIFVSTHSSDLVSQTPLHYSRRIFKDNGIVSCGIVNNNDFSDRALADIDFSIRLNRSHFLLSRCWLFVEGLSDFYIMHNLLNIFATDIDCSNISIIEYSQLYGKCDPFINLANCLGIKWVLLSDSDQSGIEYFNHANNLTINSGNSYTFKLTQPNIELEFWHNGFDNIISQLYKQKNNKMPEISNINNDIKYIVKGFGSKIFFAQQLISKVNKNNINSLPPTICELINCIIKLVRV
jgi:putative ATP-dependent endonuclease of OLD family